LVRLLFASFGLFNIYTWASVGTVFCFRKARYGGAGWVTYSEAPTPFVIWATLYSIPLLIPIILLAGHVLTRRQHRRMAFRQMVDGGGPAPIKRSIDQR
jgi:hypothetical protein